MTKRIKKILGGILLTLTFGSLIFFAVFNGTRDVLKAFIITGLSIVYVGLFILSYHLIFD
mgnify:CR=1 FL=1